MSVEQRSGQAPDARGRQTVLIWAALTAGVAGFTAVAWYLVASATVDLGLIDPALLPFIAAVIVPAGVAGFAVRGVLVRRIPESASDEQRATAHQAATIAGFGLADGAGIALVTASMVAGSTTWILIGGGASVLLLAAMKPDPQAGGRRGSAR